MSNQEVLDILDQWIEEALLAGDHSRVAAMYLDRMLISRAAYQQN
jgi:hypothetical protein